MFDSLLLRGSHSVKAAEFRPILQLITKPVLKNGNMSRAIRPQRTAKPVLEFADVERLCSRRYEREARQHGWLRIGGLDEAGRRSLFGPVAAAAVILSPTRRIVGLDDSKKINPERRFILAERI